MRRSRLYLAISVLSLVFGVALGQARSHSHCGGFDRSCPFGDGDCGDSGWCEEGGSAEDIDYHHDEVFRMVQTRDYTAMRHHAAALLEYDSQDPLHHAMLGYACRGQQDFSQAEQNYLEAIKRAEDSDYGGFDNEMVIADSHIGLAANYHKWGKQAEARNHIEIALHLADKLRRSNQDKGSYYQLACAYAVRSMLETGRQSARDRGSAMANLRFAIAHGFTNWDHMNGDLDLESLHGYRAFENLFPDGYEFE